MRILQASFLLIVSVCLLSGCGETPLYTKSYSFKDQKWDIATKPVFKFEVKDTSKFHTLILSLRTSTEYDFSDLWFFMYTASPNGESGRVPYKFLIANPDGSWAGNKSGSVVEQELKFSHRKFPQKGWYTFTLEQGVTQDIVKDVLDISLTVEQDQKQ